MPSQRRYLRYAANKAVNPAAFDPVPASMSSATMSEAQGARPAARPSAHPSGAWSTPERTGFNIDKPDSQEVAYAWKRVSCGGMEDTEHQVICEMNGWTPVPGSTIDLLVVTVATGRSFAAAVLMEQPKEWEKESRSLDEFAAKQTLEEQGSAL